MDVPEEQKAHVRNLLKEGKRILAIKYLSTHFALGLKDAKKMADLIERDIIADGGEIGAAKDRSIPDLSGCFIGKLFKIISLVFFGIAIYFLVDDFQLISNAKEVIGTVVSNPSKPIFEYHLDGEKFNYEATVSSNPPSYYIGEEVSMFVNPNQPDEVLINTFTDRWLVTVILGSMGFVFLLVGVATSKIFSRIGSAVQKL
jgi:hypothetical protein